MTVVEGAEEPLSRRGWRNGRRMSEGREEMGGSEEGTGLQDRWLEEGLGRKQGPGAAPNVACHHSACTVWG